MWIDSNAPDERMGDEIVPPPVGVCNPGPCGLPYHRGPHYDAWVRCMARVKTGPVASFAVESLTVDDLMHATLESRPFNREGWIHESKLDGFRAFVRRSGNSIEILSRSGPSLNETFPELLRVLPMMPDRTVVDCELVVPDDRGFPSFARLRRRAVMKLKKSIWAAAAEHPSTLCVFDCLALEGRDLRALPLLERKAAIAPFIEYIPSVQRVAYFERDEVTAFAAAVAVGYEGIVCKQADSPYRAGRYSTSLKIRNSNYQRQT
jgi:bifunctional non-homologous end joining protein LigD